jgi:alkanesulfonate monooxygenase SsuD/methylene tetrahydromethanopterin reductase-like flavin-dependent oxidoreductase (luciferase family)
MPPIKTGILLWNQASDWPSYLAAAQRTDELGYDTFWAWDHLYAIFGDPLQDIFEGWASLSALAVATQRLKLGLLVGANTFRNPGVVAKLATTLDHMSGGRAMLGLGGAWMEPEHTAMGIDFGAGFGQRLDWLEESVTAVEAMLAGDAFTSDPGGRYQFNAAEAHPLPLQKRLPIMIGGSGEKKTLRTVAKHADLWNAMGTPDEMAHKVNVLRGHCEAVGRDISEIEFTIGVKLTIRDSAAEAERVWKAAMAHNKTSLDEVADDVTFMNVTPEEAAERIAPFVELGFRHIISEQPAPYDAETIERFIGQVVPLLEKG